MCYVYCFGMIHYKHREKLHLTMQTLKASIPPSTLLFEIHNFWGIEKMEIHCIQDATI